MAKKINISARNIQAVRREAKRYITEQSRKNLQEAYPTTGHAEDVGWRPITQNKINRDLNPVTQDKMQNIAVWLYDSDPIAKRIIDLKRDFLVGEGVLVKGKEKVVDQVLQDFWVDPVNNMDMFVPDMARDIGIFGELALPTFVNTVNGHVQLGYIDPCQISKVVMNPDNCRQAVGLSLKDIPVYIDSLEKEEVALISSWRIAQGKAAPVAGKSKIQYTIINTNQNVDAPELYGRLTGETFFFAINKVTNATRGRSDLLALADWIHNYETFLFNRIERARLMNCFLWDVELTGMTQKQVDAWLAMQTIPRPSSIRAHNEKVKWSTVTSNLESNDASNEAMLFRSHIAGGAGIPVFWLGGGEGLTRATALEMSSSTFKNLKTRQKYLQYMIIQILDYVLDQAVIVGRIKKEVSLDYTVTFPPLSQKDMVPLSTTLASVANALTLALNSKMITLEEATTHMKFALDLLSGNNDLEPGDGVAADPDEGVGIPDDPGVNAGMKEAIASHKRIKARHNKAK